MEVSENFSETTAPDLATETTWRRLPHRTRKPRRLFGRNVVAEFIAAVGGPEARERLLRSLRTEGQSDPQIPNFRAPAAAAEATRRCRKRPSRRNFANCAVRPPCAPATIGLRPSRRHGASEKESR